MPLEDLATSLKNHSNLPYRIIERNRLHKLQIGPFKMREAARASQEKIKSLGYEKCFITYDMMP